jgi:hypothetical protein
MRSSRAKTRRAASLGSPRVSGSGSFGRDSDGVSPLMPTYSHSIVAGGFELMS